MLTALRVQVSPPWAPPQLLPRHPNFSTRGWRGSALPQLINLSAPSKWFPPCLISISDRLSGFHNPGKGRPTLSPQPGDPDNILRSTVISPGTSCHARLGCQFQKKWTLCCWLSAIVCERGPDIALMEKSLLLDDANNSPGHVEVRTQLSICKAPKNICEKMEKRQGRSERGRSEKQRNPSEVICISSVGMECFKSQDVSQSSRRVCLFHVPPLLRAFPWLSTAHNPNFPACIQGSPQPLKAPFPTAFLLRPLCVMPPLMLWSLPAPHPQASAHVPFSGPSPTCPSFFKKPSLTALPLELLVTSLSPRPPPGTSRNLHVPPWGAQKDQEGRERDLGIQMSPKGGGPGKRGPEECSLLLKSQRALTPFTGECPQAPKAPKVSPSCQPAEARMTFLFGLPSITGDPSSLAQSLPVWEADPPLTSKCS